MKKSLLIFTLLVLFLKQSLGFAASPQVIVFWHSLAGPLGETLNEVVDKFNHSQTHYWIKPVYKGDYVESLTSFAAAYRAKRAPELIQVFEVGTSMMLSPKGVITPLNEVLTHGKMPLPTKDFLPAVTKTYSEKGVLMAMPFNVSIPVIFYNQAALRQVGIGPNNFPKTWAEFEQILIQLKQKGHACAYTSAYPAWILIESYGAINGVSILKSPKPYIHHLSRIKAWQKKHYFDYAGRVDEAVTLFTSGHCPILSQSSGSYQSLKSLVNFKVGVALMPYDSDVLSARESNVVGGGAIWVRSGLDVKTYQGIAAFFSYLAAPQTQLYWHRHTGYLPIGLQGRYASSFKDYDSQILKLAAIDLGSNSKNIAPLPAQNQLRALYDNALTSFLSGKTSVEQSILEANQRAARVIARFRLNTQN